MADVVQLMVYFLVFVTGFIAGKLFAALQLAGFKSAQKASRASREARKSVDRLIQLAGKD